MKKDLRFWVYGALMVALVTVGTMVIKIPTPATQGYVNVGDGFIILSGFLFGPTVGFIAGGIGSALADILSGYAVWAPWTLVIKGLMGVIVGLLAAFARKSVLNKVLSFAVSEAWMVLGYYLASSIMFGFAAAITDVTSNIIQGVAGVIVGTALTQVMQSVNVFGREQ
ncbi:ECF transporter S component [Calorimonas adulescens]|uniref:ECF transporter S component n=1 Tax=Calorimonas adulescens TaxID=2606906 RepID=A0A5D8QBU1_9THEO|nr:ECF transporter S component [Calorimonas adulescens]TZE81827.1 ECF transporter S component [Calorimonas adulescens]